METGKKIRSTSKNNLFLLFKINEYSHLGIEEGLDNRRQKNLQFKKKFITALIFTYCPNIVIYCRYVFHRFTEIA